MILLGLNATFSFAQNGEKAKRKYKIRDNEKVYFRPDERPTYKDGRKAYFSELSRSLNYPIKARRFGIDGRVLVEVLLDEHGNIYGTEILEGPGYGLNEEAERVVLKIKGWLPAKENNEPVKSSIIIPVIFYLRK
ncbi:energy transducer TonB [Aureibacter tunicatorum]|nr:energy transducer TonB [Aureibacter tunicatorum]BDD07431.1 hypothetical protein AUTU_49140 [Aureibacter tunicatorum]